MKNIIFGFLILFLWNCTGSDNNSNNTSFSFPDVSIKEASMQPLFADSIKGGALFSEALLTGDGNIIAFDSDSLALLRYDASGKLLLKTGTKGLGPGEFSTHFQAIVEAGQYYAVNEVRSSNIKLYSPALEYQRDITLPFLPVAIAGSSQRGLLAAKGTMEFDRQVIWLNETGETLKEFTVPIQDRTVHFAYNFVNHISILNDSLFAISFAYQNSIHLFSFEEGLIRSFSVPDMPDRSPVGNNGIGLPTNLIIQGLSGTPNGDEIAVLTNHYEDGSRIGQRIQIFNLDGKRKQVYWVDRPLTRLKSTASEIYSFTAFSKNLYRIILK